MAKLQDSACMACYGDWEQQPAWDQQLNWLGPHGK